uniref:P-type domain-containing protein n=1 Tax=Trichuris muris TaxID=70415 RepID=A0A5S6R1Y4_TRIMR
MGEAYTNMTDGLSRNFLRPETLRRRWVPMAVIAAAVLILIIVIVAVSVPIARNPDKVEPIVEHLRVDCHPDPEANERACRRRGCVWTLAVENYSAPSCYYPSSYGYALSRWESATKLILQRVPIANEKEPVSVPIPELLLSYEFFGNEIAHVKIVNNAQSRYEPPVPLWPEGQPSPTASSQRLAFNGYNVSGKFVFEIVDKQRPTKALFNSSIGGLVYNTQFLQIATYLSSDTLYGFGENLHRTLRHNLSSFKTWPMFSRDQPPLSVTEHRGNLYGVHPFYVVLEQDGNACGVLFWNSNAQEYTTGPGPSLVYRTIGGILDMYIFSGPSPNDVIRQYWRLIGKPTMPAYWSLGFQLSRYGYQNTSVVSGVVNRMREQEIPHDVQYVDIDYMDQNAGFTLDPTNFKDLPDLVNKTRRENALRWVFIINPTINVVRRDYAPFVSAAIADLFITWPEERFVPPLNDMYPNTKGTAVMLGTGWPYNNVAFPDFFKPNVSLWWKQLILDFRKTLEFDGLWIDMNEPANFGTDEDPPWYSSDPNLKDIPPLRCPKNKVNDPPYLTEAAYLWGTRLNAKTLCLFAKQGPSGEYYHYDVHSLYGWSETEPTLMALREATGNRGFLLSRSTFPSSGRYTGHWLGDNYSEWPDMKASIIGMLEFNMFGIPHVGADICGFNGDADEELCARWHQLGAFYPLSRNHNGKMTDKGKYQVDQDPTQWDSVQEAAKNSLALKYYYLPYLYTLFYKAHVDGEMVVRPLSFSFPTDNLTYDIDRQFMWGPAMLITPALEPDTISVVGYFPNAKWYNIYEDYQNGLCVSPGYRRLRAPLGGPPPVHVRGGYILPRQRPALNTNQSREQPFELLVAIDSANNHSVGHLYWDDGEMTDPSDCSFFFDFTYSVEDNNGSLTFNLTKAPANDTSCRLRLPELHVVELLGAEQPAQPDSVTCDGKVVELTDSDVSYNRHLRKLTITKRNLVDWNTMTQYDIKTLQWRFFG